MQVQESVAVYFTDYSMDRLMVTATCVGAAAGGTVGCDIMVELPVFLP